MVPVTHSNKYELRGCSWRAWFWFDVGCRHQSFLLLLLFFPFHKLHDEWLFNKQYQVLGILYIKYAFDKSFEKLSVYFLVHIFIFSFTLNDRRWHFSALKLYKRRIQSINTFHANKNWINQTARKTTNWHFKYSLWLEWKAKGGVKELSIAVSDEGSVLRETGVQRFVATLFPNDNVNSIQ